MQRSFQYPLLDRILRDRWLPPPSRRTKGLSVSTIGSNTPRLVDASKKLLAFGTFSIHYWIEYSATSSAWKSRDRVLAFQYPLLDRILRDNPGSFRFSILIATFSIHYWIEYSATARSSCDSRQAGALSVSTIGSNTPRPNRRASFAGSSILSVSTIGSNTPRRQFPLA